MIRDIAVNLSVDGKRDQARDYALNLAASFGAQLTGASVAYKIGIPPIGMDVGVAAVDLLERSEEEDREAGQAAIRACEALSAKATVSTATRVIDASFESAGANFANFARNFDLAVVPQPNPDADDRDERIVQSVLFYSGRPAIVVPYIHDGRFTANHVTICWDGSIPATRALAAAMPFVTRAKEVEVLTIHAPNDPVRSESAREIVQHLARHGVDAKVTLVTLTGDIDIGNLILSHIAEAGTDLLIMGGYGHSWLREAVFGGVTRQLLDCMTCAVLMAT